MCCGLCALYGRLLNKLQVALQDVGPGCLACHDSLRDDTAIQVAVALGCLRAHWER